MCCFEDRSASLGLGQRKPALDHRLDAVLVDEGEHFAEVLRIADLAADDAGALQEDAGGGDLELVARRRSVDDDPRAGLDRADIVGEAGRRGAVEDDVDPAGQLAHLPCANRDRCSSTRPWRPSRGRGRAPRRFRL